MSDEWIDELRRGPADTDPRVGFKEELRTRLLAGRNGTITSVQPPTGRRRRWWLLGAAAACVAVLVGGLVLLAGDDRALTPSTVPTPTPTTTPGTVPSNTTGPASTVATESSVPVTAAVADLVVSDASAISLDGWVDPASMPSLDAAIVEIDRQALPSGWVVSDEAGSLSVFPDGTVGYSLTAVVTAGEETFDVSVARDSFQDPDPCFLPLARYSGTVGDLTGATVGAAVCGTTDDGTALAVVPSTDPNPEVQPSALDVADALSLVRADDLPHPDLTVEVGDDEPADVAFAGTLRGVRWSVTVEPSGTWKIWNYVAGNSLGGMEGISQAFPLDQPQPIMDSSVQGVPGYGAIAYGHVAGDAVSVIVTTNDQRTARLPMLPGDGRSAFAVPLPDTVDVDTVAFVSDDGTPIAVVDVPDMPVGYGGGSLSLTPRR
jgi:hypothetical protein